MTARFRTAFMTMLGTVTGREVRRVPCHGSHSLVEAGAGGPLFLLRAGTLDRERRQSTAVRGVDLQALAARPVAAVVFLCEEFGGPLVVPAGVLLPHLNAARPRTVLHLCVGAAGEITLVETGHDLRAYRGEAALRRLVAEPTRQATPAHSHAAWQTAIAVIGHCRGERVYVPAADRSRLVRPLAAGLDPRAWAALPAPGARIPSLRFADVVWTGYGNPWPRVVCEVEEGGDVWAALSRHAHTLAALRAAGAPRLPQFVVVAAARRRREWSRKVDRPLFTEIGLTERCEFWSYDAVWAAYRWLRGARRLQQRLDRLGDAA